MTTPEPDPAASAPAPAPPRGRRVDQLAAYLAEHPDGARVSQIASDLGLHKPNISTMLHQLEGAGCARRESLPGTRAHLWRPTPSMSRAEPSGSPHTPPGPAVERHIDRLATYLARHPEGVQASRIDSDLGIDRPYTSKLLRTLEAIGYARRDDQRRWRRTDLWRPTALTTRPVPRRLPPPGRRALRQPAPSVSDRLIDAAHAPRWTTRSAAEQWLATHLPPEESRAELGALLHADEIVVDGVLLALRLDTGPGTDLDRALIARTLLSSVGAVVRERVADDLDRWIRALDADLDAPASQERPSPPNDARAHVGVLRVIAARIRDATPILDTITDPAADRPADGAPRPGAVEDEHPPRCAQSA
ncbi:IclR-like helix-turn-helix domain-containing protein [Murinocardiopsis flavida]|uniref:IclR-like helix-turn-helix domain-containing protein n=1 Tax=Murinocardiopsis flavida TaxID=645275 RepID=A0A2P8DG02_9ACTN|nr:helix-turn-helix domain-containing protein [Murinocardiopsis flavida]PSK96141.1 IclR-like helix-turn-helix domain-containing protein [Murinocardiopsis flavida]